SARQQARVPPRAPPSHRAIAARVRVKPARPSDSLRRATRTDDAVGDIVVLPSGGIDSERKSFVSNLSRQAQPIAPLSRKAVAIDFPHVIEVRLRSSERCDGVTRE